MKNEILKILNYSGNKIKLVDNQDTSDIMGALIKYHEVYKKDYDKIYHFFLRNSVDGSLKSIFNFLKNNVDYKIESTKNQIIKSPASIIATGKTTGSDCKSFSSFINGTIDAINRSGKFKIPFCYRFASYIILEDNPQHVFSVAFPSTENEIWIDPVLPNFDNKKKYYFKIDKKPKMALYSLSGITCNSLGKTREERKKKRDARKYGEDCKGRTGAKIAPPLILGRKAFLFLLEINLRQMGRKMVLLMRNPVTRVRVLEKWCKMGGNAAKLKKVVSKIEKKLIAKNKITAGIDFMPMIGFDPATITAAITAASPYIAAFTPLLALASRLAPAGSTASNILETASEAGESLQP